VGSAGEPSFLCWTEFVLVQRSVISLLFSIIHRVKWLEDMERLREPIWRRDAKHPNKTTLLFISEFS
jgi:hypothetical protein